MDFPIPSRNAVRDLRKGNRKSATAVAWQPVFRPPLLSLPPCSPPSRTPSAPRFAVAAQSLTVAARGACENHGRDGRMASPRSNKRMAPSNPRANFFAIKIRDGPLAHSLIKRDQETGPGPSNSMAVLTPFCGFSQRDCSPAAHYCLFNATHVAMHTSLTEPQRSTANCILRRDADIIPRPCRYDPLRSFSARFPLPP